MFSCRGDLRLVLIHLERKLGVHVPAVVAGGVGELGRAALRAADVMNGPQRVVGAAFALARLAVLLNGEHVELTPAPAHPKQGAAAVLQVLACTSDTMKKQRRVTARRLKERYVRGERRFCQGKR